MSMRAEANTGPENRMMDILREIGFGDLLNLLITAITPTDPTRTVTSNLLTLPAQPTILYQVKATTGTSTGVKTLLKGPITGSQKITPAPGQAVWDGGTKVLFNVADAVTQASSTYSTAADVTASILARDIGQNP